MRGQCLEWKREAEKWTEEGGRGGREKEKDEQREGRAAEGGEGQREGIQCSSWNSAAMQAHLLSGANEVGVV